MQPLDAQRRLRDLQHAFARSARTPLNIDEDGHSLREEFYDPLVLDAVLEVPGRRAADRIGVYNQQYWFRLLTVMQEEHPLLRRILGLVEFNRLAAAYLDRYPSRHPSLNRISDFLGDFLEAEAPLLLQQAGRLDYLHIRAFDAGQHPIFDTQTCSPEAAEDLLAQPILFQPSWRLFREDWNLVAARRQAVADREDNIITPVPGTAHWAIFRGLHGVEQESLNIVQYRLLTMLTDGASLASACNAITNDISADEASNLQRSIGGWFHHWAKLGWFAGIDENAQRMTEKET
jgi:hypothetical protein